MPRGCTICPHPQRTDIDKALIAGESIPKMSALYRVSEDALHRHKANHLAESVVKAAEHEDVRHAIDIYKQLKGINAAALNILTEARQTGDHDIALKAMDRVQRQIEFQAKLLGELDERPQVNILVSAEWLTVRDVLMAALAPYPEARIAVASKLAEFSGAR